MLRGKAVINNMTLVADGKTYSFGGSRITHELHYLIEAFEKADSVELLADYEYWYSGNDDGINAGPFVLSTHIELLLKAYLKLSDNIFYCMYNEAECLGNGITVAYGKKDGKMYFGVTDKNEFEI